MAITYRLVKGSALTAAENDANFTFVESELATKCDTTDARLSDARTPTTHQHPISDVTDLQTALDAKADASDLTLLQSDVDTKVADTDPRLTDARAIVDGDYGGFVVTGGVAALDTQSVVDEVAAADATQAASIASAIASAIVDVIVTPMAATGFLRVNDTGDGLVAEVPTPDELTPADSGYTGSVTLDFATPVHRTPAGQPTTGNITFQEPTNLPVDGRGEWIVEFGGAHSITWPSGWKVPGGIPYTGTSGDTVHFMFYREDDSPSIVHVFSTAPLVAVS